MFEFVISLPVKFEVTSGLKINFHKMRVFKKTHNFEKERGRSLTDVLPAWCCNRDRIRPRNDPDPDVDVRSNKGMTKLHVVALEGNLHDARQLLRDGADVNAQIPPEYEEAGYTALHYAVKGSNYEVVKLLLKNHARVNVRSIHGMTPLHIAAGIENVPIVSTLIKHGAFIYAEYALPESEKYIPLHFAMKAGITNNVRLLLEGGAKKKYTPIHHKFGDSTFRVASTLTDYAILAYVFTWHVDFNKKCDKYALINSVAGDEMAYAEIAESVAKWLFDSFSTLNCELLLPAILHGAAELGYTRIINNFLKWGVDVNNVCHPLHARVPDGNFGYTLLHTAAMYKRNYNLVKVLINHGADVNAMDIKRRTPIYFPIKNLDVSMTSLLSRNGAIFKTSGRRYS